MQRLLFSTIDVREVRLKNRIVVSPMLTYSARNGFVNESHLVHLGKFAVGGAGLVFMESTKVDPRGCTTARDCGLWKDEFIAPLKRITGAVKSFGAAAGIQLGHSGRKARNSLPWEGRAPLANCPGVSPDMQQAFATQGAEPTTATPEELGAFVKSEIAKYGKAIKELGIRVE